MTGNRTFDRKQLDEWKFPQALFYFTFSIITFSIHHWAAHVAFWQRLTLHLAFARKGRSSRANMPLWRTVLWVRRKGAPNIGNIINAQLKTVFCHSNSLEKFIATFKNKKRVRMWKNRLKCSDSQISIFSVRKSFILGSRKNRWPETDSLNNNSLINWFQRIIN